MDDLLRSQVSILWPHLTFEQRYELARGVAWVESGGRKNLKGEVTSPGSTDSWPEVARDIFERMRERDADL